MIEPADVICSARQLGDVIGVSSRQIERLTVDGVLKPVRSRFRARHYRLGDSVQAYSRHDRDCLREKFSRNGSNDYEDARARRMLAVAKREELETQLRTGQLIDRTSATIAVTNAISIVRNHVLSIPTRCARRLVGQTDASKVHSILKTHCRAALREAHDFGLEMCEKESRDGQRDDDDTTTRREQKERR